MTTDQYSVKRGVIKQVLSGDALVLQGPVSNAGPPKEITIYLSYVAAPRLAKRPGDSSAGTSDEPYAWEAREFLRKKIVGKTVVFVRDFLATSGREHGKIYLGGTSIENAENINESGVKEGWLEVKPGKQLDESVQKLLTLQEEAKSEKKGRWADDGQSHVRNVTWTIDDLRSLVEQYKDQPIDAVIEQVRDGNSVRAFLLPSFEYVTVMFSGIKAPSPSNREGRSEEYGEEAKFFVESRLLQRDVKIVLESASGQNFIGSVLHPTRGNIAEFLLKDGYAKCVEWSLNSVTGGAQPLRDAERYAKDHKLRLWKNYVSNALAAGERKTFNLKVIEIGLGDSLTGIKDNGEEIKVYFSSLRPPRRENNAGNEGGTGAVGRAFRPLYDIPNMFETREFLRKKIIGRKVQVTIDYIQQKTDQFPEKTCCTVLSNGQNLAELLIQEGLAKTLRHRGDDENRSPHYEALLTAESGAEKAKKGLWSDEKEKSIRVNELQGDASRSKQFLPYLQRSTRIDGVVEFVASGSRLRVYCPKDSVLITFLLGAINCPRGARIGPGGKLQGENEPYSQEALSFTKTNLLQHDVQIEVENMDKAGGFIGTLFVKNEKGGQSNFAELLIEQGLATVHFAAEKSRYYNQLLSAEERAKKHRLNLWKDYVEEDETAKQVAATEPGERKMNLKKVLAAAVYKGNLQFTAQSFSDGPAIESLMGELQTEMGSPNSHNEYKPRRGEVVACYDEHIKLWHRAKVESIKAERADVLYIDFGNRENVATKYLAPLPKSLGSKPPLCHEYKLALVQLPNKSDFAAETDQAFEEILMSAQYLELNTEYKVANIEAVTVFSPGEDGKKIDVGKYLIEVGLALAEPKRESRFKELVADYQAAEKNARQQRLNIWRYGDFTGQEV